MKKETLLEIFIITTIVLFILFLFLLIINPKVAEESENTATTVGNLPTITFITENGTKILEVEIADSDEERAQGLMYRKSLPENQGMLFISDVPEQQGFWMKNTHIPLDIIFVDENKQIINIASNTVPNQTSELYKSNGDALYVVETYAGWCNKNGIEKGDKIEF